MAFALQLLAAWNLSPADFGTVKHLDLLARVMAATNRARLELMSRLPHDRLHSLLEEEYFERYRREISGEPHASRGTTHISVLDATGNEAAMTVSNGEGCGYLIPGTGIMLNNMLGEEDLQPGGFHQWRENRRMTSMMSPTLVTLGDARCMALGSGGSNRIRTALMQVISNRVDFAMTPERAVEVPRIHCERGQLDIEPGYSAETLAQLLGLYPDGNIWHERNLFFGGVHAVERDGGHFHGVGDPRRGGVSRLA
jgi:gamma-glutamyltranspeptidase/glutathione hydrolase